MPNDNMMIKLPTPQSIEQVIASLPAPEGALEWGIQSMTTDTVRAMTLLAASRSEHFRYALAVSVGIAQFLYDAPEGSVTQKAAFLRTQQDGTRIGIFDQLDLHVIQQPVPEDLEEEYLMLLVLDDNHLVDSYVLSRLRLPADHVVKTIKINKSEY